MNDFETMYIKYSPDVYRYVYSLCKNKEVAEDITQDAFYKAMEHIDGFEGNFYVWICQIAKNTYFTFLKRQKKYVLEAELELPETEDTNFEEKLVEQDMTWKLHKFLHQLKEPYKEVFSLRIFGELSFGKIGELFGKSDSWARLVFYRAKNELRRKLDESEM